MKPTTSRTRIVTQKPSRRGCRTCRTRKIKCDETRPLCRKCSSTGRHCDGYELSPESSRTNSSRRLLPKSGSNDRSKSSSKAPSSPALIALQPQSSPISTTDKERNAFTFFLHSGARDLWRVSPTKTWIPLAIQFATTEPAVFQAITAFATTQRALAVCVHKVLEAPRARQDAEFALEQFGRAMSSLRSYINKSGEREQGASSAEPVLLCAILFLCFELMRGKYRNAVTHLQFGRRILESLSSVDETGHDGELQRSSPGLKAFSKDLVDAFGDAFRVLGFSIIYPHQSGGLDEDMRQSIAMVPQPIPIAFTSPEQAQEHLDILSQARNDVRTFLVQSAEARITSFDQQSTDPGILLCVTHCLTRAVARTSPQNVQRRIADLISAHNAWLTALEPLVQQASASTSPQQILLLIVLRAKHFFALHALRTCTSVHETIHDAYHSEFAALVEHLQRFFVLVAANDTIPGVTSPALPLHPYAEKQLSFSIEPGVLPAMAMVAFKCRDSRLRRRVINMLQTARRREGGLFSEGMGAFIEQIVRIEEKEARSMMHLEMDQCVDAQSKTPPAAAEIPEMARFLDIAMWGRNDGCTRIAAARFRHEDGENAVLEIREWDWRIANGYPVVLEEIGKRVVGYPC